MTKNKITIVRPLEENKTTFILEPLTFDNVLGILNRFTPNCKQAIVYDYYNAYSIKDNKITIIYENRMEKIWF